MYTKVVVYFYFGFYNLHVKNSIVVTVNIQLTKMFHNWMMTKTTKMSKKKRWSASFMFLSIYYLNSILLYYLQVARSMFIKCQVPYFTLYFCNSSFMFPFLIINLVWRKLSYFNSPIKSCKGALIFVSFSSYLIEPPIQCLLCINVNSSSKMTIQ